VRRRHSLTQEALAERAGVTARVIQRWESGRVFPNEDSLQRLAVALGMSREELIGLPDPPSASFGDQLRRVEELQLELAERVATLQEDLEQMRHDLAPLVVLAKRRNGATRQGS
jgi:transcriptional regulator with XRE-family HTH domain